MIRLYGILFLRLLLVIQDATLYYSAYFGKRKQVTKVTFLVKEQNVSVIYTDVNGISWCLI